MVHEPHVQAEQTMCVERIALPSAHGPRDEHNWARVSYLPFRRAHSAPTISCWRSRFCCGQRVNRPISPDAYPTLTSVRRTCLDPHDCTYRRRNIRTDANSAAAATPGSGTGVVKLTNVGKYG